MNRNVKKSFPILPLFTILLILSVAFGGCSGEEGIDTEYKIKTETSTGKNKLLAPPGADSDLEKPRESGLIVYSAFENYGKIPVEYTCDGIDVSPAIRIEDINVEKGAKSVSIIVEDPDAPLGVFTHWVIWGIPVKINSSTLEVPKAIPKKGEIKDPIEAVQGINDFGKIGYNGPCPPSGEHTYLFKVYILEKMINLSPGSGKKDLKNAMDGHILQEITLYGRYSRNK